MGAYGSVSNGLSIDEAREFLSRHGYVHLRDVFRVSDVAAARDLIDGLFVKQEKIRKAYPARHASSRNDVERCISEVNHALKINPRLKSLGLFRNCRNLAAGMLRRPGWVSFDHAIYKPPGAGVIDWHQDQAYKSTVKAMQSMHFWIPLQDTAAGQGCMRYVRNSHTLPVFPHMNCATSNTLFLNFKEEWNRDVVVFEAKMGDAILHLPNTIHGSQPNHGSCVRKAWILHFSPYGRYEVFLPHNLLHNVKNRIRGWRAKVVTSWREI